MNNKVLIIWLWQQWQKYINFFLKNWYTIDWVCKTNETKIKISRKYFINVFLDMDDINVSNYDLIIFALPPAIQWKMAIEILSLWYKNKIIIEIPISFNREEIIELSKYKNVFFFLEEYYTLLWEFLRKSNIELIKKIKISIYTNKADYENINARKVTFFHINSNFIWLNIKSEIFDYNINFHGKEDIFYEVSFSYNWISIFYSFREEKFLKIWEKKYKDDFNFDKVLSKIILNKNNNFLFSYFVNNI